MKTIQQRLTEIAPGIFSGTPVLFAYLYGSHATGMSHKYSDLDIAVFLQNAERVDTLDLELRLSLRVDELLAHRVDTEVSAINLLPLPVVGSILTEGLLFYTISEEKRVAFETRGRMAYFGFLPVIKLHRNAYIEKATEA